MSRRIPTWMRHGKCPRIKCPKYKTYQITGTFIYHELFEWLDEMLRRRAMIPRTWSLINRRRRRR